MDAPPIALQVVYAPASRKVLQAMLHLTHPVTVQDALCALPAPWRAEVDLLDHTGDLGISIWGKRASRQAVLQAGDRLELCRPLRVDPKVARRERFVQQGKKRPGLFARKKEIPPT
jgi:uncharacterized protein